MRSSDTDANESGSLFIDTTITRYTRAEWDLLVRLPGRMVAAATSDDSGGAEQSMIEAFETRHGLHIVHAWGMTEMAPLGTIGHLPHDLAGAPDEAKFGARAKQGLIGGFHQFLRVAVRFRNRNAKCGGNGKGRALGNSE